MVILQQCFWRQKTDILSPNFPNPNQVCCVPKTHHTQRTAFLQHSTTSEPCLWLVYKAERDTIPLEPPRIPQCLASGQKKKGSLIVGFLFRTQKQRHTQVDGWREGLLQVSIFKVSKGQAGGWRFWSCGIRGWWRHEKLKLSLSLSYL